jgi:hypothetical protein
VGLGQHAPKAVTPVCRRNYEETCTCRACEAHREIMAKEAERER